jgi:hypothetical protein
MNTRYSRAAGLAVVVMAHSALAQPFVQVVPDLPHAASSEIPWGMTSGSTGIVVHQVLASSIFSDLVGPHRTVNIERIAFAPTSAAGTFSGQVALRLGYTSAIPGALPGSGGLGIPHPPAPGSAGAPNAPWMYHIFNGPVQHTIVSPDPGNFALSFQTAPFHYDHSSGNLLLEIVISGQTAGFATSSAAGGALTSSTFRRADGSTGQTGEASRIEITYSVGRICWANCDGSTTEPILNVEDFVCFINEFAAGWSIHGCIYTNEPCYANCDNSTTPPILNVEDFACFINAFAAGCP